MASFNFNRGKHGNVSLVGRKIGANNREESDFTRSLSRIMDETILESEDTAVRGGKGSLARTMMAVEMGAREIRVEKEEWGL